MIDELHTYRGVFGSHLANVIRRLKRICASTAPTPSSSAARPPSPTPASWPSRLIEEPVELVDHNGAPRRARDVRLLQPARGEPPAGHPPQRPRWRRAGHRRAVPAGQRHADHRLRPQPPLGGGAAHLPAGGRGQAPSQARGRVRGYRGGYLPNERRAIERGLREGPVRERGQHQRAGAGHRHRRPGRLRAGRLPRHHRQHLAADGPGRAAPWAALSLFVSPPATPWTSSS